jgi:SHS2 domain-containing protein
MGRWSHFPHEADVGLLGEGSTVEEAFAMAALALTAVVTQPERVQPQEPLSIHCEAPNLEFLLLDWLNAIIYEMAVKQMLFSEFHVMITGCRLNANLRGERVNRARHEPAVEPKGATMTELSVHSRDGLWQATCVIDV